MLLIALFLFVSEMQYIILNRVVSLQSVTVEFKIFRARNFAVQG